MPSARYKSYLSPYLGARCLLASALAIALLAAGSAAAEAHTELLDSSPEDGAALRKAPTQITLSFSDDIDPKLATVVLTVGNHREKLDTTVDQGEVTADVPREVDAGTPGSASWKVAYRVVSADGHPVSGAIDFDAPAPPRPAPTQDPASTDATTPEVTVAPEEADDTELASSSEDSTSDGSPFVWVLVLGLGLILIVPALAWKFRNRPTS